VDSLREELLLAILHADESRPVAAKRVEDVETNLDQRASADDARPPGDAPRGPWWKTPAAVIAAVIVLILVGLGILFGLREFATDRASAPAPVKPPLRTVAALPLGAVYCDPVYPEIQSPFTASARGTATTSCAYAEQVRRTYASRTATKAPTDQFPAVSPATGKWYAMACIPSGEYVTCTGGAAAVVYLYNN
jgi:hypothetical protein